LVLALSSSPVNVVIDLLWWRLLTIRLRSSLVTLMAVAKVCSLAWTLLILANFFIISTVGLLLPLLLIKLLICSSLAKHRLSLELTSGEASARAVYSMSVSVASVLLTVPVPPSSKIIDWILRGIYIENSLHYLDCLFTLEVAAIGFIDGEVLDLSSGKDGSLEQTDQMPLVLGMLKVYEEAPA